MGLTYLDWSIVAGVFLILCIVAVFTKRYTRSVSDFISANRCAGRYLLGGSELMAMTSATMFVAQYESTYKAGFVLSWWSYFFVAFWLIRALSGWVQYRFRETRALTMAQFFEIRYSKNFRIFAGILAWVSGIINFVIHPAVTSRLIVYFCGLPLTFNFFGAELSTIFVVMLIMLSFGVILALAGGQVTLMITDWLQGQLVLIISLIVTLFLLYQIGWTTIIDTLKTVPTGQSKLNPFDTGNVSDFNIWYILMAAFLSFYQEMAFQGNQGYFGAAKNPHEAKMARIFGTWRGMFLMLAYIIPGIVTFVIFFNPDFSSKAGIINQTLSKITEEQTQVQMRTPLTLALLLPIGLKGFLASVFIASSLSTDDTYLHAWGSIFIQDVIMPIRKKPMSPKQHLRWLRFSVIFVAVIALTIGSFIPIRDYILMYFQITFAIYAGGIGAIIIGGLYWKRGTTSGAWSAAITGSILCLMGFIVRTIWEDTPLLINIRPECPFNGMHATFFSSIVSVIVYITVSLLSGNKSFNLEKMLHRGKYQIEGEHIQVEKKIGLFRKLTGIDNEFTLFDKIITVIIICYSFFWFFAAIIGSSMHLIVGISDDGWANWWLFAIIIMVSVGLVTFIWFFIGGVIDVKNVFKTLSTIERLDTDDGRVADDHNLADEELIDKK